MGTTLNQKGITTLGGTTGLVDQTDKMHSGLIKALEVFSQGSKVIGHEGFEIYDSGSYVGYRLHQPFHFKILGRHVKYETDIEIAYTSNQRDANYDTYDWVLLNPNLSGNPQLVIVGGGLNGANALVGEISNGLIPVALVKVPAGTDTDDITGYQAQLYTFNNQTESLSLGYSDGASPPYYKNTLSAISAAAGTTFTNTIGDLIFDNIDNDDQIVMRLGTNTSATGFEVRNNSDDAKFKVGSNGWTDVIGNLVVTQGSTGGQPALKVDNDDVDKVALGIDAANTTATVLDITANAVTSGSLIKTASSALTTGVVLDLVSTSTPTDGNGSAPHLFKTAQAGTGTHAITGMVLNVDKTGVTASGKTNTLTGLHVDIDDSATNNANATVNITGLDLDITSANAQGTLKNIGLDVAVAGADTNYAALLNGGNVGIGTSTPTAALHVIHSGTDDTIRLESTDFGPNLAPDLVFKRNSASSITFTDATCDFAPHTGTDAAKRIITHNANANIVAGLRVSGTGIPATSHIVSITDATHFVINLNTTGSGAVTNATLTFGAGPANGDLIGHIKFLGTVSSNDLGTGTEGEHEFVDIYARANDITTGSEDGELYFRTFLGGTQTRRLDLTPNEAVFNEDGADINFRIESDASTHILFIDAGDSRVGIKANNPASTLDVGGNARIVSPTDAAGTALIVDNADADQQAIHIEAANIDANVLDITADALTTSHAINITADSLTTGSMINLVSDSSQTNSRKLINIHNDNTAAVATIPLYIKNDSTGDCIVMESTNDGTAAEPSLVFNRNSASPVDGDLLGNMIFKGKDSGGNATIFANIQSRIADTANTAEAGSLYYQMLHQGATKTFMYMTGSTDSFGATTFNYNGVDIDFIVHGENVSNLLRVDANTDRVAIGSNVPKNKLQINHTGADGSNGLMIVREDASTGDGDLLGGIGFDSTDGNVPSSVLESSAFIASLATQDHTGNDKGGNLKFGVSLIDENEDVVSTVLASVGPPDTIANAACHAGFNSRATTAIVAAATYAPTITDSGTLVIFEHANSNLTLPSINNTTSVGVQFTVFNETGSAINAQIAVSNSATVNGGAIAALDDIASFKAATFVCSGNNTWIRIG